MRQLNKKEMNKNRKFKLLKIQDGKYFVKFNDFETPIELNKFIFEKWMAEVSNKTNHIDDVNSMLHTHN